MPRPGIRRGKLDEVFRTGGGRGIRCRRGAWSGEPACLPSGCSSPVDRRQGEVGEEEAGSAQVGTTAEEAVEEAVTAAAVEETAPMVEERWTPSTSGRQTSRCA